MRESGIEAGARIIKGLGLIVLCTQSLSSVLLSLEQSQERRDGSNMVGMPVIVRSLDSLCASERIPFLSGRV